MFCRSAFVRLISLFLTTVLLVGCGSPASLLPSVAVSQTQASEPQQTADFSVKYWETAWDATNVAIGIFDCVWGWDGWACGAAALDVGATLLPIPGGMSSLNRARKATSSAQKVKKTVTFSKHARDRMAERRISEAHVKEVVAKGRRSKGNQSGTYVYEYNGRTVVVSDSLNVITVYGKPSWGHGSSW